MVWLFAGHLLFFAARTAIQGYQLALFNIKLTLFDHLPFMESVLAHAACVGFGFCFAGFVDRVDLCHNFQLQQAIERVIPERPSSAPMQLQDQKITKATGDGGIVANCQSVHQCSARHLVVFLQIFTTTTILPCAALHAVLDIVVHPL